MFIYMCVLFCVYLHVSTYTLRGQKRALDSLALILQVFVS